MITYIIRDVLSQAEAPSLPVVTPRECHSSDLPTPRQVGLPAFLLWEPGSFLLSAELPVWINFR